MPSPPTYEDYARKVPQSLLNNTVDARRDIDIHLSEIAKVLVNWEGIAPWLGLKEMDIYDISSSRHSAELKRSVNPRSPEYLALSSSQRFENVLML